MLLVLASFFGVTFGELSMMTQTMGNKDMDDEEAGLNRPNSSRKSTGSGWLPYFCYFMIGTFDFVGNCFGVVGLAYAGSGVSLSTALPCSPNSCIK